jgi:CxxC motif-containing protein (DUF1111 family)
MTWQNAKNICFVAALAFFLHSISIPKGVCADDAEILKPTTDFTKPEKYEANSAGALTSKNLLSNNAFSQGSPNLSFEKELLFKVGNGLFKRLWVSAPASTQASDGLGPLFNSRSCQRCHLKDGRGRPPLENFPTDSTVSMVMRLSIPPQTIYQLNLIKSGRLNAVPDPIYGSQLQNFAIQGQHAEGRVNVSYVNEPITLRGGEVAVLRKPTYTIIDEGYGDFHPDIMISPRIAPQMIGLGLLEAISETDILTLADPTDLNGDGISGKPNWVWSASLNRAALGRFGLKAGKATMTDQTTTAFSRDMGISSPLAPNSFGDCTVNQPICQKAPNGNSEQHNNVEASQRALDLVTFYSRNLAVPVRRNINSKSVLAGKKHFYEAGCISCHVPKFITKRQISELPEQERQLIWPYTDMLLHDMGEGLADHSQEGLANGREWRTAPLWGIGMTRSVSKHTFFLHDGRARNLTEAILWHSGEAEISKKKFKNMRPSERKNLISFLNSL